MIQRVPVSITRLESARVHASEKSRLRNIMKEHTRRQRNLSSQDVTFLLLTGGTIQKNDAQLRLSMGNMPDTGILISTKWDSDYRQYTIASGHQVITATSRLY